MNAAKLPTSTVFKSAATLLDATSRRSFANMTKGMGREGGGRGPGGPHRTPKNVGGIAGRGGASGDGGGGAFAELRARRNAMNLERDLEAARKATESAAGSVGGGGADRGGAGRGAGIGGFGGRGGRGDGGRGGGRGGRVPHTRNHPPRQYPHQHPSGGTDGNPPSHRVAHRGGPPKANFAETVLRPAAEGGDNPSNGSNDDNGNANANAGGPPPYSSGIPKLSARKHKGHAVHDAEQLMSAAPKGYRRSGRASVRGEMRGVVLGDLEKESAAGAGGGSTDNNNNNATSGYGGDRRFARDSPMHNRQRAIGLKSNHPSSTPDMEWEQQMSKMMIVSNNGLINDNDTDGYDSDDDLDPIISPDDDDYMDMNNHELIEKRGTDYIVHMDLGGDEEESRDNNRRGGNRSQQQPPTEIPGEYDPMTDSIEYQYLFRDITDIDNELLLRPSKPKSDAVLPLRAHGDELDDFLEATMDHPSKYAVIERSVKHADSKREARPTFPRNRKLPSEEFVNRFKGYLFVDGLVHPQLSKKGEKEEVWEWEDPLHQQSMKEVVAKIFGVTSLDVWPATATSAFVGFATKIEAKGAMIKSVENSSVVHPTALVAFDGLEEEGDGVTDVQKEFVAASSGGTGSILKVTGLPVGITSVEVLQAMFPRGSKLESMFGPLTKDDYLLLSPTTALVRLASSDLVSKALKSSNIAKNVSLIGKRNLQVLRAKRERVFDGWTGPNRAHAKSKLGNRLLVHGDVPPEDLFLSHNDVMHISGLPPTVTLNDLATFFQPFCADRRDILGSGHIVRCSQGVPTGSAYIGFELPGEMDQVKELYNGQATIGGADVRLRLVRDKMLRRGVREGARPARSIQELDLDLSDWERHVDPKDVEELETLGIDKSILNEIMITLRHHNRTFGAVDQAIPGERLYKERQVGMHYRDVVRKYVKVLKECTGTKDNPGLMYEAMFSPDQDVDMGLLDFEEKRIADLRTRGI